MTDFALHPDTQAFLQRTHPLLIGGQRPTASDGGQIDVINPANGKRLTQVARATSADIDRAVAAARSAFEDSAWSRMTPVERERLLWRFADLIEANADSLAELECLDNGKSAAIAKAVDIQLAVNFLRYMAGWATKIEGSSVQPSVPFMPGAQFHGYTRREPIGVVGAIVAWNFPLLLACWKLGPALATGCTVVLKPAEDTPLTALRLGELALEAGYPPGVLNVVPGLGQYAG
ncbi:MAG: aldehyde dehydrogenase family protein, partial [Oceanospirillales bacterium]|nr:aldehyde dehydrogenase family protein [Oceanospirillales bacterium]